MNAQQTFVKDLGIQYPIIGGAMYPCSNPELVAAISQAGGIGIVQPISLTYVHGYEFREGLRFIKTLTDKPIGMNVLIEKSSKKYHRRMQQWIDIALEEGIRFFVTSLGKPDWVVKQVHAMGGLVYHDVTEKKWADIGINCGVDGLICVNNQAGGHAGGLTADDLISELQSLNVPLICAGGISDKTGFQAMLDVGYAACQLGTRFIASTECSANRHYKQAIIDADKKDIVLTKQLTGVPVAVIKPSRLTGDDLQISAIARWLLSNKHSKRWLRMIYSLKSLWTLKRSLSSQSAKQSYWQAGKSVANINNVSSCKDIIKDLCTK